MYKCLKNFSTNSSKPPGTSTYEIYLKALKSNRKDASETFVHWLNDEDRNVSSAVVHGFLFGVFAACGTENDKLREMFFDKFLALQARRRGENVTKFMDHKIRKGKL